VVSPSGGGQRGEIVIASRNQKKIEETSSMLTDLRKSKREKGGPF
jgi:inosine/xanthosine triphosphate pyrophosphatase family protein